MNTKYLHRYQIRFRGNGSLAFNYIEFKDDNPIITLTAFKLGVSSCIKKLYDIRSKKGLEYYTEKIDKHQYDLISHQVLIDA